MKGKWMAVGMATLLAVGLFGALPVPRAKAATCTSQATGNWSAPGTWTGCSSTIPQTGDDVVIAAGHTVTVDTNTASINSLTVNGTLRFDNSGSGKSMTVTGGGITINSGGTLDVATGGSATTHTLTVGGDLTNNGTFDALPAAGRIINVTFNKNGNQAVSGSGTTRFNVLTVDLGTSNTNVLDVQAVISLNASANPLVIKNGTFKLSSASTIAPFTSGAGATIPVSGGTSAGFWLNGGTITAGNYTWTIANNGVLRVSNGTLNIGTNSGNSLEYNTGSSFIIEGGSVNIAGRFSADTETQTTTFNMSGGTLTLATVGHSATKAGFDIPATGSSFTMSGGTVVLQRESTNATPLDYRNVAGTVAITGGTVQFGNASTTGSPSFEVGASGGGASVFPNLFINATGTPSVNLKTGVVVNGNFTVSNGTTLTANAQSISLTGNWTNNGTFTAGTGTVSFNGTAGQTIGGTASTTFNNLTINNSSPDSAGVSLGIEQTVNGTLTLTDGLVKVGPYDLTLGPNATISGGSVGSMIVTDTDGSVMYDQDFQDGFLCKKYADGTYDPAAFNFPVGDSYGTTQYSPATLDFHSNTFNGSEACVRVTNAKHPSKPSDTEYPTWINRYWTVKHVSIYPFTCDTTFSYREDGSGDDVVIGSGQSEAALFHKIWYEGSWTTGNQANTTTNTFSSTVSFGSIVSSLSRRPLGITDFFKSFDHTAFSGSPLAVALASFTAEATPAGVTLRWETVSERESAGFQVLRSAAVDGPREALAFVPSAAPDSTAGASYTYVDASARPGRTYWYWLEDVDLRGATSLHGPVSVQTAPRRLWLPLIGR